MKQDRFLFGILIGIAVLIVIALVLFFIRKDNMTYIADDSPDGVIHNYVVAIHKGDYKKAYSYLADKTNKPTYEQFRDSFRTGRVNPQNVGVDVGKVDISSDEATVELNIIYNPSDPFSTGYRNIDRGLLEKQSGAWRITSMPYNYWEYNWYQPTPVYPPVKVP
jgi:hypothetical protein